MSIKQTRKSLLQKLAQPLLITLLSVSGSVILSHGAASQEASTGMTESDLEQRIQQIPPAQIKAWQDAEKERKEFYEGQGERRKNAKNIDFGEEKDMDDVEKSYPFLHEDLQKARDLDQRMTANMKNTGYTIDAGAHLHIAVSQGKPNILFVEKAGRFYCGKLGCVLNVYVDDGTGYKRAGGFFYKGDMSLSRTGGQVSLYRGPPEDPETEEWILKSNEFVKNEPPVVPESGLLLRWHHDVDNLQRMKANQNNQSVSPNAPPAPANDTLAPEGH